MFHLLTHAVTFSIFGLYRCINPVTLLCSTASCNLLDSVNDSSLNSPMTVDTASHFKASSIAQSTSFCRHRSMKMIRSGSIPKAFNAGGNIVLLLLTHRVVPLFTNWLISAAINPLVAAASSFAWLINSCTAPNGNAWPGNAFSISHRPVLRRSPDTFLGLCMESTSFCSC